MHNYNGGDFLLSFVFQFTEIAMEQLVCSIHRPQTFCNRATRWDYWFVNQKFGSVGGDKEKKNRVNRALSHSTGRADRRHAPQSLLEGCVHHHPPTLPVVQRSAVGQVLRETKDHYNMFITIPSTVLNPIQTWIAPIKDWETQLGYFVRFCHPDERCCSVPRTKSWTHENFYVPGKKKLKTRGASQHYPDQIAHN